MEYRIKENQQQWDTRKEEVASDEAREQQLAKQLVPLRAEIGPLQKQRGQFDQIVRTHRKLLAEVDDEKSELAKMMQALSDRHREMRAEENKHEERRAKNEVWEKAQREAREAREKAQREAREAREKAQREAREARERAEWEVRYLEQREEWEREMRARQPLQILLKYLRDIWAQFLELVGYKPLDEASDQPQKSPEEKV